MMLKLMKKLLMSSILLLPLITAGCATTKADLILPPKPQREEMPEIKSTKDFANVINYYEHLVQEWEQWGCSVDEILGQ